MLFKEFEKEVAGESSVGSDEVDSFDFRGVGDEEGRKSVTDGDGVVELDCCWFSRFLGFGHDVLMMISVVLTAAIIIIINLPLMIIVDESLFDIFLPSRQMEIPV